MWWLFRTYFPEKYLHFIGVPDRLELSDGDRAALDDIVPWVFPIHDRAAGVIFDTFASNPSINRPFSEALSVPALLVHAADDPLAPYDGAVRLAGRIRCARLVTLPRGGHLQLGTARTELRSVVEGFLNELRVPRRLPAAVPRTSGLRLSDRAG